MILCHGRAFAFESHKIGCVDSTIVAPLVNFISPQILWSLLPIRVPKAHLPKLLELLNEKIKMEILEPSIASYSNR
jgi:hypothetical protein